jgi:superfamily I DNA and/or RNA helicase
MLKLYFRNLKKQSQSTTIIERIGKQNPKIKISTVDGFQGQERDVVILSMVRSNEQRNLRIY